MLVKPQHDIVGPKYDYLLLKSNYKVCVELQNTTYNIIVILLLECTNKCDVEWFSRGTIRGVTSWRRQSVERHQAFDVLSVIAWLWDPLTGSWLRVTTENRPAPGHALFFDSFTIFVSLLLVHFDSFFDLTIISCQFLCAVLQRTVWFHKRFSLKPDKLRIFFWFYCSKYLWKHLLLNLRKKEICVEAGIC